MSDGYEFNAMENRIFSDLAGAMKFVGIALMVVGAVQLIAVVGGALDGLIAGPVSIITGMWTVRAAGYVTKIVSTEGNDIMLLMAAMGEMSKLYRLQRALLIIAFALLLVAILVLLVVGVSA